MAIASKDERNARLDALGAAITAWASKRTKQLNAQVTFSKRLLKGRTGSERLTTASVNVASDLVVDEIEHFLTGGE
jgi:hypothetical protein